MHDLLSFKWNFQIPDNHVHRAILKLTSILSILVKSEKSTYYQSVHSSTTNETTVNSLINGHAN